jgi:erythromycin esterase-like protein
MLASWFTTSLLLGAVQVMTPVFGTASPISGAESDYGDLIAHIGTARFVLLGEASHGTSDFYRERSRISQRLIRDGALGAVIIEADGTEVERANRYVRGLGQDETAAQALSDVIRLPRWMWRNVEFRDFLEALRTENRGRPPARRVGVYGMDVYDLFGALRRVETYARRHLPGVVPAARAAATCFAPHRSNPEAYGVAARKVSRSCEGQAATLLAAVKEAPAPAEAEAAEERFAADQAAAAVVAGEAYYRAAFAGSYSWNVRERSMAGAVRAVAAHVGPAAGAGRVIVWATTTTSAMPRAPRWRIAEK